MVNKKRFKIISIITTIFVITTLISIKGLITKATIASRPEFDIEFKELSGTSPMVGEDIVVEGTLIPKPFEIDIDNIDTEIVMVIDENSKNSNGSGSFNALMQSIRSFIAGNLNLNGNVKLGVIDYSRDATIYNYNGNNLIDIKDKDKIANYIGGLKVNSGNNNSKKTNTGEALRKAAYLMETPKNPGLENKIIILLSNGTPTARTSYVEGLNEIGPYIDISKEKYDKPKVEVLSDNYEKDMEYSKTIGNIIKEKGYTVYTIGYDVNNDKNAQADLIKIHEAMTGYKLDNTDEYEKKRFYTIGKKFNNQELDVDKIFSLIQKDILESYQIDNMNMNINFTGDFSLNIGGNTVNLNNINYKLVSQSNGKARYEADEIPFKFIIKGNKEGYQQIFDKVTITYPWKGSMEEVNINKSLSITITSNTLPDIRAKLKSDSYIETNKNGEITLEYEITPNEFTATNLNFTNKEIGEAIFLVGLSSNITDNQRFSFFQNSIANKILDNLKSIKYGVIGYNDSNYYVGDNINEKHTDLSRDDAELKVNPGIENIISPLYDINIGQNKDEFRYYFFDDGQAESIFKYKSLDSNKTIDVDKSLEIAMDVFDKFGDEKKGKAIILINATDVNYSENIVNEIKNKGYKIISLDIINKTNIDYNDLHLDMGGTDNDYLIATSSEVNFNNTDHYMEEVAKRLNGGVTNNNLSITPKFTFDLNDNFEYIEGSDNNNNISLVSSYGNKLEFNLDNPIKYENSGIMVGNQYKFTASSRIISFKVKLKETQESNVTFGINNIDRLSNYMSYNNFSDKELKVMLQTPIIRIKDISHGLYNGINNGQVSISETNSGKAFEIAQGSTVTFGANFTFGGSITEFTLNVDSKFSSLNASDIKIYKILKDEVGNSSIKEIEDNYQDIDKIENNKFKIAITKKPEDESSSTEILVVYQGKVIDATASGQTLTNDIVFSSTSKKATIVTPQQSNDSPILPDLF